MIDLTTLAGLRVVVSPLATRKPTPGEWARRFVRHGMADVLDWLGEDVGPHPDDRVPGALVNNQAGLVVVHPAIDAALRGRAHNLVKEGS